MSVNYEKNKSKGSYVELKPDIAFEELFLKHKDDTTTSANRAGRMKQKIYEAGTKLMTPSEGSNGEVEAVDTSHNEAGQSIHSLDDRACQLHTL